MQILAALLSLLFYSPATEAAVKNFSFTCVTSPPTTSFLLQQVGDEAVLTTIHHNGTGYMPIHEGIVVPNDLGYLQSVATELTKMGDRNEFHFPVKGCKFYGPGMMSCADGDTKQFAGTNMQALLLQVSRVTERAFGHTFETYKVTLSVNISDFAPVQDIMMKYQPTECKMQF